MLFRHKKIFSCLPNICLLFIRKPGEKFQSVGMKPEKKNDRISNRGPDIGKKINIYFIFPHKFQCHVWITNYRENAIYEAVP